LARTVQDAAVLLSVLAGPDPRDSTTRGRPPLFELLLGAEDQVAGLRVGVLRAPPFAPLEPDVETALDRAVALLASDGVELDETLLPELDRSLTTEFAIVAAEAASYHETRLARSGELIGEDVRGLLEAGLLLPASLYLRAQRTRRMIQQAVAATFADLQLNALIAPTVPAAAQRRDQLEYELGGAHEPVIDALVRTTAPFNLVGLPAVAVPTGLGARGLPGSVQIIARPFDERTALRLARVVERGAGRLGTPRGLELALADPI
jgi:aspartyl-tRNA(Asn)/glutamyl-tRNA(Gln) amidotransferase subunit A